MPNKKLWLQTDEKGNHIVISNDSRATNEKIYTQFLLEIQAPCWGMEYGGRHFQAH
jgi:hypothetical protein